MWGVKRKQPYTEIGIRRLKCIRCGKPARYQWQICSDGNNFRPICETCDIELNEVVLNWIGHPNAQELLTVYKESKL